MPLTEPRRNHPGRSTWLLRRAVGLAGLGLLVHCQSSAPPAPHADAGALDGAIDASLPADAHGGPDAADAAPPCQDADGPTIAGLVVTPNPNGNLLTPTLAFTTDRPATAQAFVSNVSPGESANAFATPVSSLETSHALLLLGLRSASSFLVTVQVRDAQGHCSSATTTFSTAALPPIIPPIHVVTNDKTRTSPGYTVITLWAYTGSTVASVAKGSSMLVLDSDFQVVWYYVPAASFPWDPKKLPNGHFVLLDGYDRWEEVDMTSTVVASHTARSMGLPSVSHELLPELDGNVLSISSALEYVSGYEDGGVTYPIVGDRTAEFTMDGGVLGTWSAFDMAPQIDPHNEGTVSFFQGTVYDFIYPDAGATKDWTHGNSLAIDPSDGTLISSSRTLSWIYKFTRTGSGAPRVLWRLGPGGDFTLTNPNETFQYNQHGANLTPSGTIMCFDDGFGRPLVGGGPPPGGPWSRAVEFSIDTTKKTATIVWQYQETPSFYSYFLGSSYVLPNGNVLIDDGAEMSVRNSLPPDPTNFKSARIFEVTHTTPPEKVAEFAVDLPRGQYSPDPTYSGFVVYRATRIPSLY